MNNLAAGGDGMRERFVIGRDRNARAFRDRLRPAVAAVVWLAGILGPMPARAQTAERLEVAVFERQAAAIFSPAAITRPDGELSTACDRLLLIMQGVSVAVVVAGMILRMRQDHEQMEGIASMMLKVAFIATIPFWRTFVLETVDLTADAIGYRAVATDGASSAVMTRMWHLAGEWMPASSPYLDALETQAGENVPASGDEQAWSLRAWNWARGIGTTTGDQFQSLWQSASGGLRAVVVFGGCAAMSGAVLLTILFAYLAEVLRFLLYYAGGALLPVFIAGLGVEMLRRQSARFILGLATIAGWPIGWALVNVVTMIVLDGASTWMETLTTAALGLPTGTADPPSVAAAAPFLAWGALFMFMALTTVICLWSLAGLLLAPLALGRMAAAGAQAVGGFVVARSNVGAVFASCRGDRVTAAMMAPRITSLAPPAIASESAVVRVGGGAFARSGQVAGWRAESVRSMPRSETIPATAGREADGLPSWLPLPKALRQVPERN